MEQDQPLQQPTPLPTGIGENTQVPDKHSLVWLWIVIVVVLVVGSSVFLIGGYLHSLPTSQTGAIPPVKTVDFSPDVPVSQKTALLIQESDSSMEKVLIKSTLLPGYLKTLPSGFHLVSQTSAQ